MGQFGTGAEIADNKLSAGGGQLYVDDFQTVGIGITLKLGVSDDGFAEEAGCLTVVVGFVLHVYFSGVVLECEHGVVKVARSAIEVCLIST